MIRRTGLLALAALLAPATVAAPTPASAAASATCRGTVTSHADIDGDSKRDTLTVTQVRGGDRPVHRLCVRTATGRVSSILDTAEWQFYNDPLVYGVTGMDGNRGAEIILRSGYGAHSQSFHVYRWSAGRLVPQYDLGTGSREWLIDAAVSVIKGYQFSSSRGVRYATSSYGQKDPSASVFDVTRTTYRWTGTGWKRVKVTRSKVRDATRAAPNIVGWRGLPVPTGY